jgi:hypothetical protein
MLKLGLGTISTAFAMLFLAAAQVSADTGPQPPIAGGVQPVTASAGSSSQPNGNASVSSGRAWGSAEGQQAQGNSCGVQAAGAGNGYAVQPTSAGTSGTSSPTCGSGATAGAAAGQGSGAAAGGQGVGVGTGSGANGSGATNAAAGSGAGSTGLSRGLTALGIQGLGSGNNGAHGGPAWWAWLLLALLIGFLFFLLGLAVAPKRRQQTNPA